MKHCPHGFLIPPEIVAFGQTQDARQILQTGAKVSPYCLECWSDPVVGEMFAKRFFEKPACSDPCTYGFCDLITQVARKRGFSRDAHGREAKEMDLRIRLLEKKAVIEQATKDKSKLEIDAYILRTLKNFLTNEQTTREAWIIQNSVKSLSPE